MKPPLTIAYSLADQSFQLAASIGILNLSSELVLNLATQGNVDSIVILKNSSIELEMPDSAHVRVRSYNQVLRNRINRIVWDQLGVYSAAKNVGTDWLFLPKGFASFVRRCPVRLATYVHDVIQEYYVERFPEARSGLERRYFQTSFKASLRHSNVVFTNSNFTRDEILRYSQKHNIAPPNIVVAGIGFRRAGLPNASKANSIMVLCSKYAHKRSDLAVKYLTKWQLGSGYAGRISWVGSLPSGLELPNFSNWKRAARLDEDEFRSLLGAAKVLVYFSEYEGFGMPPVEAVLAGTCPVYSWLPATREVMLGCGKGFENQDYGSFSSALDEALLVTEVELDAWKGRLQVHSWSSVADRVVRALTAFGGPSAGRLDS